MNGKNLTIALLLFILFTGLATIGFKQAPSSDDRYCEIGIELIKEDKLIGCYLEDYDYIVDYNEADYPSWAPPVAAIGLVGALITIIVISFIATKED